MAAKNKIRSAFSEKHRVYNPLSGEPTRVKQEFKDDVNINSIIRRMKNGQNPPSWMTSNTPHYGDFSNMPTSFMEAHAIMEAGNAAFLSLPLALRRELDHDPRNLDQMTQEQYERFGLLKPRADQAAPEAPASLSPAPEANLSSESRPGSKKGHANKAQAPKNDSDQES